MAVFKPLTKSKPAADSLKTKDNPAETLRPQSIPELIQSTSERIYIVYDDSGSMSHEIDGQSTQVLAAEATTEYMKNCKPHVTAIEIAPLDNAPIILTKNLPLVASQIKAIDSTGDSTPLFAALGKLIDSCKEKKMTRALIFTDGGASDPYYLSQRPRLFEEVKELGIPVDLIIIQESTSLPSSMPEFKKMAEDTGGTFMICKDGKSFKAKMKYFAPLLRHQLAAVASAGN